MCQDRSDISCVIFGSLQTRSAVRVRTRPHSCSLLVGCGSLPPNMEPKTLKTLKHKQRHTANKSQGPKKGTVQYHHARIAPNVSVQVVDLILCFSFLDFLFDLLWPVCVLILRSDRTCKIQLSLEQLDPIEVALGLMQKHGAYRLWFLSAMCHTGSGYRHADIFVRYPRNESHH